MSITNGFTATPNYILLDNRLSVGAKLTWQIFAMRENLKNWTHHLRTIANMLNKHVDTIRSYVRELIQFGYLARRKKDNQEFGYIYSIPETHIPVRKTSVDKSTAGKTSVGKTSAYNKKDSINTDLNKKERNKPPTLTKINNQNINAQEPQEDIVCPVTETKKQYSEGVVSMKTLIPEGEWKNDQTGWFKQGFLEWKAKWAIAQFNDLPSLDKGVIWAENHLTNHPEKLPLYWMQYQRDFDQKAENAKMRMDSDISLKPEEQGNLARTYLEINQPPVNLKAKFNLTLMTRYQKMGGKNQLGDFVEWSKSEQVNQLFLEWQKDN